MIKDFEKVHCVVDSEGTRVSKFYSRAGDAKRKAEVMSKYGQYESVSMFCVDSRERVWASAGSKLAGLVPLQVERSLNGKEDTVKLTLGSTTQPIGFSITGSYKYEN